MAEMGARLVFDNFELFSIMALPRKVPPRAYPHKLTHDVHINVVTDPDMPPVRSISRRAVFRSSLALYEPCTHYICIPPRPRPVLSMILLPSSIVLTAGTHSLLPPTLIHSLLPPTLTHLLLRILPTCGRDTPAWPSPQRLSTRRCFTAVQSLPPRLFSGVST